MTDEQFRLLLTVARVLRTKISGEIYAEKDDDLFSLNDAMKPYDPVSDKTVDEAA
jgi:hypothetical protein